MSRLLDSVAVLARPVDRRRPRRVRAAMLGIMLVVTTAACDTSVERLALRDSGFVIGAWEVSRPFQDGEIDRSSYPGFLVIGGAGWRDAAADETGFVDVSDSPESAEPESDGIQTVLARARWASATGRPIELSIESDTEIDGFLNGRGIAIDEDGSATVGLQRGLNELLLMVTGPIAGSPWRTIVASADDGPLTIESVQLDHERLAEVWRTEPVLRTPESVLYDPARDVLYVTSYDIRSAFGPEPAGFVTRLSLDGEVLDLEWVGGLRGPAGMALAGDALYVAERQGLAEIDVETGAIRNRYPIPGAGFPNDVAIDEAGAVYVTDTTPTAAPGSGIHRMVDGVFELWAHGADLDRPNGLLWVAGSDDDGFRGGRLLVGNSGDGVLKAVDITTGALAPLVSLGAGILDGIKVVPGEGSLLSLWQGRVFVLEGPAGLEGDAGRLVEILDTTRVPSATADLEYIANGRLVVVPTFLADRVVAYRLSGPRTVAVPHGNPPEIDGAVTDDEWAGAAVHRLSDGTELLLLNDGENAYLGLRGAELAIGSICVAGPDEVSVLHSSAALGTAVYARDDRAADDSWTLTRGFEYRVRATDLGAEAVQERAAFLAAEGWLASNANMGPPGHMEYQIALPEHPLTLAVTYHTHDPDSGEVLVGMWPPDLEDTCALPDDVGEVPEPMVFDVLGWVTLLPRPAREE